MNTLPSKEKSFWREAYPGRTYSKLQGDLRVDVVIVGAGITGLTSAYLLKKSGHRVAVVEKDTVGGGTTGRTTGKVTSQHSLIYADFKTRLGDTAARQYGQANQAAIQKVEEIISNEKINCEWTRQDNYVFTTKKDQVQKFKDEARVAVQLGLPATFETTSPLPFEIEAAVRFSNQGRIHSQKYLLGLAEAVDGDGSYVFEGSNATGIHDGSTCRVKTVDGKVYSKHIIVATNVPTMPLIARGAYCLLEYPNESYLVSGRLDKAFEGMFISTDSDEYSILPVKSEGKDYILVGGGGHISGMRLSKDKRFNKLARYARERFDVNKIDYKWSDRDYMTYDGPPLAGKAYPWSKNLYVASAFRKWGLSNGTTSAMIIHDLIMGIPNEWAEIYKPTRIRPILNIPRVAAQYATGQQ